MRTIDADALFINLEGMMEVSPTGYIHGDTIADMISDAPTIEPEPKWISVSERLPEENGEYLVTREARGIYKYVDIVKKTNTSGDIASDIVAWMPLPEPYREEGEK